MSDCQNIVFRESDHTYWLGGRRLVSVTQACSLLTDFASIPDEVLARKGAIGRAVHSACQFLEEGMLDWETVDPSLAGCVRGWEKFKSDAGFNITRMEDVVFSETLGYAGRLDRTGYLKNQSQAWVVEIKTSNPAPWHGVQLTAYGMALQGFYRRLGVYLSPDGTYTSKEYTDRNDWRLFQSCLAVYQAREAFLKGNINEHPCTRS